MEGPSRKRQRTASVPQQNYSADNPKSDPSLLEALPDELLVQIFRHIDSISRKRIERVCWRWKSLLRETTSLHDHVKMDVSLLPLPNSRSCVPVEVRKLDNFEATLKRLLTENAAARLLHITDDSKPARPRPDLAPQFKRLIPNEWNAMIVVCRLLEQHVKVNKCRVHLIFEKVPVDFESADLYFMLVRTQTYISCVEFREAIIARLAQIYILYNSYHFRLSADHAEYSAYYTGPRVEFNRRVTGCVHLGADQPYGGHALMELIEQYEEPLTADEEREFGRVMATVRLDRSRGAAEELVRAMRCTFTKERLTRRQIVCGAMLKPFVKRFLIAAEDMLAYFDSRSQPLVAQNAAEGGLAAEN